VAEVQLQRRRRLGWPGMRRGGQAPRGHRPTRQQVPWRGSLNPSPEGPSSASSPAPSAAEPYS
jgi:hypothetical protein